MLALASSAGTTFDLAILDYQMPDEDGLSLARSMRADARWRDIAVCALTSMAVQRPPLDGEGGSVDVWLTKPVRRKRLLEGVCRLLEQRSAAACPPDPAAPLPSRMSEGESADGPVVLIVDDNSTNQLIVRHLLRKLGMRSVTVGSGEEAIESARVGAFDAILMDCQMPGIDGYEATAAIRALEGSRKRTPIVALTANAMPGDRERCLAAGMDAYVSKPVRLDALRVALQEVWQRGIETKSAP